MKLESVKVCEPQALGREDSPTGLPMLEVGAGRWQQKLDHPEAEVPVSGSHRGAQSCSSLHQWRLLQTCNEDWEWVPLAGAPALLRILSLVCL